MLWEASVLWVTSAFSGWEGDLHGERVGKENTGFLV